MTYCHGSRSKRNVKRKIMDCIRAMNTNIKNDNLWRGRFYINCNTIDYRTYNDGIIYAYIRMTVIDKKTGITAATVMSDSDCTFFGGYNFWHWVNDFVCQQTMGE